jgi:putative transcriptional regulator
MDATLTGKLLVAMPGMGDPRFEHSVIMMCAHTREHAMGLIVNKPQDSLTLGDVLDHLGIEAGERLAPRQVLNGGPVRPDRGYVLHSEDFRAEEGTQEVAPGIRLTATRDVLEALASTAPPERFVLALGCAGWGAGQLEDELRQNAWLVVDAEDSIIFGEAHPDKWTAAIAQLGLDPSQLMGNAGWA